MDDMMKALPMSSLDEIPQPGPDAQRIVAVSKKGGRVDGYKLSDGSIVSKEQGVAMAKAGKIQGVGIAHRKDSVYLRSLPDDSERNNLGNLPAVQSDGMQ